MLRLVRENKVTVVQRPKDEPYLYMPNPPKTFTESTKIKHFLGLVDLFIALGKPNVFLIEQKINEHYQPDVYTRIPHPVIIEYQRTRIGSKSKLQEKVNKFYEARLNKQHDSSTLIIATEQPPQEMKIPKEIIVEQIEPVHIADTAKGNKVDML